MSNDVKLDIKHKQTMQDRLDMFADVIKLCGEYLDVLCGSNKQIRGEVNGNQTSKGTQHDRII